MTITEQALDLAPKDAEVIPGVHVPGFTGQGWSSHETMLIVRWLFAHPDAWDQAMATARDPMSNPHTVADTLHEKLVPRAELDAIAAQGFDPAKVNWLEIAHELIERRDDPKPAAVSLAATISAQVTAIELVGAEGYIHGFICVRPPCGPKPTRVLASALTVGRDGSVVHASGWAVGHVEKHPTQRGLYVATQADGKQTVQVGKDSALKAVAASANKTMKDGTAAPPAPAAPARRAVAPPKAAPPPPAPAKAASRPAGAVAGKPKPEPASGSGPERSGPAVWKSDEGTASLSAAEKNSIANVWYGGNFYSTNRYLRRDPSDRTLSGDPTSILDRYSAGVNSDAERQKYIADIGTFKTAISKAQPFTSAVKLLRGVNHPDDIFGPVGSTIGKSFTDKGFSSATSNMGVADSYSHGFGGKTALITIHAPKGTRALKVDPDVWNRAKTKKGQTPPEVLQEYTFAPGTSYKILADTLGADGVRRMDVEPQ